MTPNNLPINLLRSAKNHRAVHSEKSGHGELRVEMVSGESAVVSVSANSPLKILAPQSRGPSVWAYASSFGGGLVAGDETRIDITLADHTRCYFGTQASTKVYRNPDSRPCGHTTTARLGANSILVLAPDQVQPFRDSIYEQRQEFYLLPDSGLVLVDWLSSGRAARGERWAFGRYQSRNEVFMSGERIVLESMLLDAADGAIDSPYRLGRFNCLALMLVMGGSVKPAAAHLLESIANRPVPRRAELVCSASPLAHGALVRVAGERVEDVKNEIHRLLDFVPSLLQDDPRRRKW